LAQVLFSYSTTIPITMMRYVLISAVTILIVGAAKPAGTVIEEECSSSQQLVKEKLEEELRQMKDVTLAVLDTSEKEAGAFHDFKKLLQAKSNANFQDVAEKVQQDTTLFQHIRRRAKRSECEKAALEYEKAGKGYCKTSKVGKSLHRGKKCPC